MGILNQIKFIPNLLMSACSSSFVAADAVTGSLFDFGALVSNLWTLLMQLVYFSCKWGMYIVDVMYFYILQLAGVSMDTSSLKAITSGDSDMVFNFLINNEELVGQILRNFTALAIILIIVTAIIAIIKQQFASLKEKDIKKAKVNTGSIFRSMGKSLVLIVITPLIAILGIIASNILLKALFNATNLSNANSLSARVFNVSTLSANRYRIYAENGARIPVKMNFDVDDKDAVVEYTVNVFGSEYFPKLESFNQSKYQVGVENYLTYDFKKNKDSIDNMIQTGDSFTIQGDKYSYDQFINNYYKYFDYGEDYNNEKNARFEAYPEEYYVMADVVEFAMDTMEPVHFTTIEDVLISVQNSPSLFRSIVETFNIEILCNATQRYNIAEDTSNPYTYADFAITSVSGNTFYRIGYNGAEFSNFEMMQYAIQNRQFRYIRFTSNYANQAHTYVHVAGETDELNGAKYVISIADSHITYEEALNGNYVYYNSQYQKADKLYVMDGNLYKKADAYYERKISLKGGIEYNKVSELVDGQTYYYKIGGQFEKVTDSTVFYYLVDGEYKEVVSSTKFYNEVVNYTYSPLYTGFRMPEIDAMFDSDYLEMGNIVVAKGIFDNAGYPTIIYKTDSGDIMFYRDDLEYASSDTVKDAASLEQAETGDSGGIGGALSAGIKFITGLFQPEKLTPNLKLDASKLALHYTNKSVNVFTLKQGKMHISYFFSDALTSGISESMYGLRLSSLFDPNSINYIILAVGTAIFVKICFQSVFALIARTLDLFLLILIYPLACATIPLIENDGKGSANNTGYSKWSQQYTRKLLATYGLILALNFVFILIPIIDEIEFFTVTQLQNNLAASRLSKALMTIGRVVTFGTFELKYSHLCVFLNGMLSIMFQLAAFSVIAPLGKKGHDDTFYGAISNIAGGENLDNNAGNEIIKMVKNAAQVVNFLIQPPNKKVSMILEKTTAALGTVANNLPGSAVVKAAAEKKQEMQKEQQQKTAKQELLDALKQKADPATVQQKIQVFNKAFGTSISLGDTPKKDDKKDGEKGDDKNGGGDDASARQGGGGNDQGGGNGGGGNDQGGGNSGGGNQQGGGGNNQNGGDGNDQGGGNGGGGNQGNDQGNGNGQDGNDQNDPNNPPIENANPEQDTQNPEENPDEQPSPEEKPVEETPNPDKKGPEEQTEQEDDSKKEDETTTEDDGEGSEKKGDGDTTDKPPEEANTENVNPDGNGTDTEGDDTNTGDGQGDVQEGEGDGQGDGEGDGQDGKTDGSTAGSGQNSGSSRIKSLPKKRQSKKVNMSNMSTASIKAYELVQRNRVLAAKAELEKIAEMQAKVKEKLGVLQSEEYTNKRYGSAENRVQTAKMLNSIRNAGIMTQGPIGENTKVRGQDGQEISVIEHLQQQGLLEKGKQYSDKEKEEIYKNMNNLVADVRNERTLQSQNQQLTQYRQDNLRVYIQAAEQTNDARDALEERGEKPVEQQPQPPQQQGSGQGGNPSNPSGDKK